MPGDEMDVAPQGFVKQFEDTPLWPILRQGRYRGREIARQIEHQPRLGPCLQVGKVSEDSLQFVPTLSPDEMGRQVGEGVGGHCLDAAAVLRHAVLGQAGVSSSRARRIGLAPTPRVGEPVAQRFVEHTVTRRPVRPGPPGQVNGQLLQQDRQLILRIEAGRTGQVARRERLSGGHGHLEDPPDRGKGVAIWEVAAEERLVQRSQARRQRRQVGNGNLASLDALQRLLNVEKVALATVDQYVGYLARRAAAVCQGGGQVGAFQSQPDVLPHVVQVLLFLRVQLPGTQAAQPVEHFGLFARGGHHAEPAGHAVQPRGQQVHDRQPGRLLHQRLVQGIDQEIAGAILGRVQRLQRRQNAPLETRGGVLPAGRFAEMLFDRRVVQLGGVTVRLAGDHGRQTSHETPWFERGGRIGLAAVVGQHLGVPVQVQQLGHDGRLARARIAGDQKRRLVAGGAPGVDLFEEPLPAAEVSSLPAQEGGEVPGLQVVLPGAIAHAALVGVGECFHKPAQARLVLVVGVRPGTKVDVIEPVDEQRRRATGGHDRHDRQAQLVLGIADLVETHTVGTGRVLGIGTAAHGVWAQQRDYNLAAPQPVFDLAVPGMAGADFVDVLPDLITTRRQVNAQPVGQLLGIAAPVANKDLVTFGLRWAGRGCNRGGRPWARVARWLDAGQRFGLARADCLCLVGRSDVDQPHALLVLGEVIQDQLFADLLPCVPVAAQKLEHLAIPSLALTAE